MWNPANFNEACQRAAGRRAYNKRRRLVRERRITLIIAMQGSRDFEMTGRELATLFHVHEATISRDLKWIRRVRAEFRKRNGAEMSARGFRFLPGGRHQTILEVRHGVRVR